MKTPFPKVTSSGSRWMWIWGENTILFAIRDKNTLRQGPGSREGKGIGDRGTEVKSQNWILLMLDRKHFNPSHSKTVTNTELTGWILKKYWCYKIFLKICLNKKFCNSFQERTSKWQKYNGFWIVLNVHLLSHFSDFPYFKSLYVNN